MSGEWTIAARVRHQLEFGSVWQDRDSVDNHDGLVRAIADSGEDRGAFVEAVAECLTAESALVRTGAVAVARGVAREIGAERLTAILRGNPALFRDVKPARGLGAETLEAALAEGIGAAVRAGDGAAIGYLRECVRKPWGLPLLFALARVDGEWLAANAGEIVPPDYEEAVRRRMGETRK